MLNLQPVPTSVATPAPIALPVAAHSTYADTKNSRFSKNVNVIVSIKQRWDETYNNLSDTQKKVVDATLESALDEFKRRYPTIKTTRDLTDSLSTAAELPMNVIDIDDSMQRQLNIRWVLFLLGVFVSSKAMPIRVYRPNPTIDEFLAWDGQHTLLVLWLLCTQLFGELPEDFVIPVTISPSNSKIEIRSCFVELNTEEGQKILDQFDKWEQMVFGTVIDGSTNPLWNSAAAKQKIMEERGLFATHAKFGDSNMPGAIGRMQEIMKMKEESFTWLCDYLVAVGAQQRPVVEKEMVMMAYFFERCRIANLKLTQSQVFDVANITKTHWNADFSQFGTFWTKASASYCNWHAANIKTGRATFKKEPVHGYPFLAEQIKKELPEFAELDSSSSSEFLPPAHTLY
jgi:hypothetical protein